MASKREFSTAERRHKRGPRTMEFTELALKRLNIRTVVAKAAKEAGKPVNQVQIWDTGTNGQRGLSVLLSSGGTKTFLVTFYLKGRPVTFKLGRVSELTLQKARPRCGIPRQGPRGHRSAPAASPQAGTTGRTAAGT